MASLVSTTTSRDTLALINDPSLLSTWTHRVWATTGCTAVLISLVKSIVGAANSRIWLGPMLSGYVGYIVADLMSGIYHWIIDNYGDATTPILGTQIESFQRHHEEPLRITKCEFANNIYELALVTTFVVMPINILCRDPIIHGFVCTWSGFGLFSQQFHAWSHCTKKTLPPLVAALQDAGVLISRSQHAAHHKRPYNSNYCIVSGACNKLLDNYKVFEAWERLLYFQFGVRPRSWNSEPGSKCDLNSLHETPSHVGVN